VVAFEVFVYENIEIINVNADDEGVT